jgi:general L-amino acid transport system permease protein
MILHVAGWLRRNLLAKPLDAALTLVVTPLCVWFIASSLRWALADADWRAVAGSLRVLTVGIYPVDQLWRAWFSAFVLAAMTGAGLGLVLPVGVRWLAIIGAALALLVALLQQFVPVGGLLPVLCCWSGLLVWAVVVLVPGARRLVAPAGLVGIGSIFIVLGRAGFDVWGGLMLSVVLTIATSLLTIPLGILLAFGRQSRIASLRVLCTGYIEVMRSVPLILVVYWIWIIVPLLAPDAGVPGLLRGMAGYALFFAAYVAEYVRSGFQALPNGQVEAARSLGMSTWSVNTDIVLPQALRVVVPTLVGQVLDIFNGATLIFIIGLTDFLRAGQMILADPQNSGRVYEIYVFMFFVYFAIGSTITYASRRLEEHLGRGTR